MVRGTGAQRWGGPAFLGGAIGCAQRDQPRLRCGPLRMIR